MDGYYGRKIGEIFNWYCKPFDLVENWGEKTIEFKIKLPEDGSDQVVYIASLNELQTLTKSQSCPRLHFALGQNFVKITVLGVYFPPPT